MRSFIIIVLILAAALGIYFYTEPMNDTPEQADNTANVDTPVTDSADTKNSAAVSANINKQRIINADKEPQNWLAHGRTYDESRFSPLTKINDDNINELGLAWYFDTNTTRGLEATPIVVDGTMFSTGSWSVVFAHNAVTGELLWTYDPKVDKAWGAYACCDVVNRGVAVWEDKVFVGTIDGYLVSLDAQTGKVLWKINTIDREKPYTITGAPRIINGNVIIGNGGAEFGVRGYITAYDVSSGEQKWRFYTVPGNPADGFESEALAEAAKTWNGEWWKYGGGGTAWDSMAYDPELNLLYLGTGNGSVWNREVRSPGGGDNLYLSSIVAINPDNGEYVWHYQTTPGDSWDYTATQHLILADLNVDGAKRKVIMQAPKNGFFYLIDRTNGKFISAKNYVPVTWATGIDPDTGRPIETSNARYQAANPLASLTPEQQAAALKSLTPDQLAGAFHLPGPLGGHNWHPMSYSKQTGLVYIPAIEIPYAYGNEPKFEFKEGRWNLANDPIANMPTVDDEVNDRIDGLLRGHLSAWDPIAQKEVWRKQHAGSWNGGILSTAGNLVIQGTSAGDLVAYKADTGETVWTFPAQTGVVAPPITFSVDGEQYITVVAGWGGAFPLVAGSAAEKMHQKNRGRILTFKLGGKETLPAIIPDGPLPSIPEETASAEQIQKGKEVFHTYCGVCHGPGVKGGGVIADLRYMGSDKHAIFNDIVLGGIFKSIGMVSFADVLTEDDANNVQAYVLSQAHKLREERNN